MQSHPMFKRATKMSGPMVTKSQEVHFEYSCLCTFYFRFCISDAFDVEIIAYNNWLHGVLVVVFLAWLGLGLVENHEYSVRLKSDSMIVLILLPHFVSVNQNMWYHTTLMLILIPKIWSHLYESWEIVDINDYNSFNCVY